MNLSSALTGLALLILTLQGSHADEKLSRSALMKQLEARKDLSFLEGKADRPYVHFFAAEAEYGAFYSMPMLALILNKTHGFNVSVSYALDAEGHIDSRVKDSLVGLELLEHADLAVFFTRTRSISKDQAMKLQAYLDSGKPLVGFRTANHGFRFDKEHPDAAYLEKQGWGHKGPKLQYMWKHLFGGHHAGGPYGEMLTAIEGIVEGQEDHPIVRGFTPYEDPRHLYILNDVKVKTIAPDDTKYTGLVRGRALRLAEHKKNLPVTQPVIIVSEESRRTFYSSTCGADTFKHPSARRLAIQGIFWALQMEDKIPQEGLPVELVAPYDPPDDTHLRSAKEGGREADPHRGKPEDVFKAK